MWGQDTFKLRPVIDFVHSIQSSQVHTRKDSSWSKHFLLLGYLPCSPCRVTASMGSINLWDLLSDEWLDFWLCWSLYQKLVASVQVAKYVTLVLIRDLISSLLTTPSFHVILGLSLLTGLPMHFTLKIIHKRSRNKGCLSHLSSWTARLNHIS